jgi:hypothetical protein
MTTNLILDIADIDTIFLTFDEPKKEESWIHIQNMIPWAKRVDGVVGSDAAHKAAAAASDTDWFVLIDGDNIPDPEFFNLQLTLGKQHAGGAFRWKARNAINGLMYGNGGMSCWSKEFVQSMRTHEASDGGDATAVEFCFDPKYWAMNDCYSTTYPNSTAFQAWRAGFREGVKMCLDRGSRLSQAEFSKRVVSRNYDNLSIWHNVGMDAENGQYAIWGARYGTYLTMCTQWNFTAVQDFTALERIWDQVKHEMTPAVNSSNWADHIRQSLTSQLGLFLVDMDAAQSKFFKHHYKSQFKNIGPMTRE